MLKKSYILNVITDAKFKYKIKYLLFLSWDWEAWCLTVWGVITPPKETLFEIRGGNVFSA